MKIIIALCAAAFLVAFVAPGLRADNSVLGKGKARDLQKQVEGQGSAGVTTPKTNAPAPKAPANSTPAKKS